MLRLRESQMSQLDELEKRQYIREIHSKILLEFPEYVHDQGLQMRLEQAYVYAVGIGFVDGSSLTQFLYLEAFAPGFYQTRAIQAWLTKHGQSAEQRFADLNAQMKSTLEEA